MYSSAPIEDLRRADVHAAGKMRKIRRLHMVGTIARWGHNTLLAAMALLTVLVVFAAFAQY